MHECHQCNLYLNVTAYIVDNIRVKYCFLPSWLLCDPDMKLRTTYPGFTEAVDSFDQLIPRVAPYQVIFSHFLTTLLLITLGFPFFLLICGGCWLWLSKYKNILKMWSLVFYQSQRLWKYMLDLFRSHFKALFLFDLLFKTFSTPRGAQL